MKLYKYFSEPEKLYNYDVANNDIPELFWREYSHDQVELLKRKKAILKSPRFSYLFLRFHPETFLSQEFVDVIASDPKYAVQYADNVLNYSRFPEGENAIATSARYSYMYALTIIQGRWEPGEDIIATNEEYKQKYYWFTGVKL